MFFICEEIFIVASLNKLIKDQTAVLQMWLVMMSQWCWGGGITCCIGSWLRVLVWASSVQLGQKHGSHKNTNTDTMETLEATEIEFTRCFVACFWSVSPENRNLAGATTLKISRKLTSSVWIHFSSKRPRLSSLTKLQLNTSDYECRDKWITKNSYRQDCTDYTLPGYCQ